MKMTLTKTPWLICAGLIVSAGVCSAYNPAIRTVRTADPSAHIWADGKVWMYTSHDVSKKYKEMDGYHAFSSSDLINWTDHGEILHSRDLAWGVSGLMWAPTAAYRNGKYYLIFPHGVETGSTAMKCGVAVSDVPQGPFKDLGFIQGVSGKWLDPCVFTDSDGQLYLYWGVNTPYVARLKDNVTELAETPRVVEYGNSNFFEGSYLHKKGDTYYFSYNAKGKGSGYATGTSPYGPFTYRGDPNPEQEQDHHSIIEYKSQSYFFYHWQNWNGGSKFQRNVAIERLHYRDDGSIVPIQVTAAGLGGAPLGQTIWLQVDGKFVSTETGGLLKANRELPAEADRFQVIDAGDGNLALKSIKNGSYVSVGAKPADRLLTTTDALGKNAKFKWTDHADGSFSLTSIANGKQVQVDDAAGEKFVWGY